MDRTEELKRVLGCVPSEPTEKKGLTSHGVWEVYNKVYETEISIGRINRNLITLRERKIIEERWIRHKAYYIIPLTSQDLSKLL